MSIHNKNFIVLLSFKSNIDYHKRNHIEVFKIKRSRLEFQYNGMRQSLTYVKVKVATNLNRARWQQKPYVV